MAAAIRRYACRCWPTNPLLQTVAVGPFLQAGARPRSLVSGVSRLVPKQEQFSRSSLSTIGARGLVAFQAPVGIGQPGGLVAVAFGAVRGKQTKRQSYVKPPRAKPCNQRMPNKPHIGIKALPAEYVEAGRVICKQRKYIAKNPLVTRRRNFKLYPGVNVKVMKSTSLQAAVSGRVKMTHDVTRGILIMNVLAEPREELQRDDLWRYRTEHIETLEENKYLCGLRAKAFAAFGKTGGWINPPLGPKPMNARISKKKDMWNNPHVQDPLEIEPFAYPMPRAALARHIRKVRRKQAGLSDDDPAFEVKDSRYHLFHGQSAQR